ncbi:MAG TPA: tetratricopeptide repeat protein, partial [Burkholderiaceae bacterium]
TAAARDASSALWHALQAGDAGLFVRTLRRFRIELADKPETDVLLDRMARRPVTPRDRVELRLSEAMLWRTRDNAEREYRACEQALRLATEQGDRLLLGLVYGTTAWFHESRDVDRALACAEDSAEFLRQAELEAAPGSAEAGEVSVEYVAALVRLAWLLVLRNSPRSRTVLDLAEARRTTPGLSHEPLAMLEQTWGEYWRRAGDLRLAIAFKHKALNISERVGDTRQTLSTYNNLSVLYLEAREYQRAIEHASRVVTHSETSAVDPYLLTSALGNIGIGLFWQQRYDEAIEMYRRGLVRAEAADLRVIAHRAHFNLAEAYFKRFQLRGDPADEAEGDRHLAIVQAAPPNERDAWFQEAAPTLKADALGLAGGFKHERFWGEESTEHFEEMREVQRQRAVLAVPAPAAAHVAARLAIANAYAAISTKERETAIAMIERHALGSAFEAEINRLGVTFSRGLTREKALMAQWKQKCYGVLTEERIGPVLHQVIATGSINKSGYAQLCQVGLATASKHLGTLTERGLLVQTGKGPSTRYMLP